MRTIPDKMRTDEVYVVAFDSILHHCQDSELPTGEHLSVSIAESSSTVLVPHASLSGQNEGCSRTGRSPAADGFGPTSLGPRVQWERQQRPPRASKDQHPDGDWVSGLGFGFLSRLRHALATKIPPRARLGWVL